MNENNEIIGNQNFTNDSDKEYNKTIILACVLGLFAIHRFINGKTKSGLIMLFTLGGCGIWWLIDIIMIITGKFTDSNGNLIKSSKPFMQTKSNLSLLFVAFVILAGGRIPESDTEITTNKEEITYKYTNEYEYETELVPAKEAVVEVAPTYTTKINGDYIIGTSPSEYVTGNEVEFTTGQSGVYTVGEDFPAGTYDLIPVSGGGNVFGPDLNVIMGVAGDDFYTNYYDNKTFRDGQTLEVSGVSLKLIPQNSDNFYILPGKYNMVAVYGGGNVFGPRINEIMGTANDGFYIKQYDNANLDNGSTLTVSGVELELQPKVKEIIVEEATEEIPAKVIKEELYITSDDKEICYVNNDEVDCSTLKYYDKMKDEYVE